MSGERMADVWRVPGRLKTDDATVAYLLDLASRQSAITGVIEDFRPDEQFPVGNGSVWASGRAVADGTPVLVKLGSSVPERELTLALHRTADDVVPRVFGAGEFDGVGWLALERCDARLDARSPADRAAVLRTDARFQDAASSIDPGSFDVDRAWLRENVESDSFDVGLPWLRHNLEAALAQGIPGNVEMAIDRLEADWEFVSNECGQTLIHGDLLFGNVVARAAGSPPLLIDTMPKLMPWCWDASYLQVAAFRELGDLQAQADGTHIPGLVHVLADARAELGLQVPRDLERVEVVVLAWAAACWWRIAPWRRDESMWRTEVGRRIDALT